MLHYLFICFFFFQAEDGIRDIGVTGVQTCALPILGDTRFDRVLQIREEAKELPLVEKFKGDNSFTFVAGSSWRREKSSVGEGSRSRVWPGHLIKKKKNIVCGV